MISLFYFILQLFNILCILFNLFDFKENAWEYVRQLLVDGELYFENIVHEKHITEGILGVINVPTQAIDPVYDNFQNMIRKLVNLNRLEFLCFQFLLKYGQKPYLTSQQFSLVLEEMGLGCGCILFLKQMGELF